MLKAAWALWRGPGTLPGHLRWLSPLPCPHHSVDRPSAGRGGSLARAGPDGRMRLSEPQKWPRRGRQRHQLRVVGFPSGDCPLLLRPLLLLRHAPRPPRPPARVSLAGGEGGGAPNLGHSGPALCCLNPSPPLSLASHVPSPPPLSFAGLQGQADTPRAAGISCYLAALLAKGQVTAVCCPQGPRKLCSLARTAGYSWGKEYGSEKRPGDELLGAEHL